MLVCQNNTSLLFISTKFQSFTSHNFTAKPVKKESVIHFYKVAVKEVRKETADCVSIEFDIPADYKEIFQYKAGQYITLRTIINDKEIRRSYSLCSSPLCNEWRIAVKKVPDGIFSSYANDILKAGSVLELMPPIGNFTSNFHPANKKHYIGLAAGSGITPVISLIKTALASEPYSSFTLVYGNRNRHSIIFKEELEALKNNYMDRFTIIHVLSREMTDAAINSGRIDQQKCDELFTKPLDFNADEFFICGPEEMINCVKDYLLSKNVNEKKIRFELFTTPDQPKRKAAINRTVANEEEVSHITIKHDGISTTFNLSMDGENILDAALYHGTELPYSCKGGVCCTCKAKLLKGRVEMEVNYSLEPEETEQGFILTCQSHPITKEVVIDFDIK